MPSLTIKNIPPALCRSLKLAAAEHHRSVNGEVIDLLSKAYSAPVFSVDDFLQKASQLRARAGIRAPDDVALRRMRTEGRA